MLVAHLLCLVNSSRYGLRQGIDPIAMTVSGMKGDGELCLGAGLSDSITKPIKRDTVPNILDKWLGD